MTLTLQLKKTLTVPVDAGCISPDVVAGKPLREVAKLPVWEGNRKRNLSDVFDIRGESGPTCAKTAIRLVGALSKARRIGADMTDGLIEVRGDVGMHLGEKMRGGTVTVDGNADSWAGSEMEDGTIVVKKNAGDYIGAAYRGSARGMKGGTIVIHGNAGTEVGGNMRKGTIHIHGDVDQFVGIRMKNGAIIVHGAAKGRAGAFMTGGKLVLCNRVESVLPSFTVDSIKTKAKAAGESFDGPFYLFIGDLAEHGNGKLYVSKNRNPQLKHLEELL